MLSRAAIRVAAPSVSRRFQRTMAVDARLAELGLKLPTAARPVAAYVMCTRVGNMIYTGEGGARRLTVRRGTAACASARHPSSSRSHTVRSHSRLPRTPQRATCPSPRMAH